MKRSQAVAAEFGVETSRSYWRWVYDVRSKAVRSAEATLVVPAGSDETAGDPPPEVARVAQAQDVLRLALRKAIEHEEFREVFESEESIRARFPLEEPDEAQTPLGVDGQIGSHRFLELRHQLTHSLAPILAWQSLLWFEVAELDEKGEVVAYGSRHLTPRDRIQGRDAARPALPAHDLRRARGHRPDAARHPRARLRSC